jgi:glucan phosphoethanolaminetransferase (alkaline phosphatase superfamily)
MLFLLLRWGLWLAFSGEMGRLGFDRLLDAVLLVAAMFYGLGVSRNLVVLSAESGPKDAGQLIRLCILAGALLPVLPIVRLLKGRVLLNRTLILAGGLVLAGLAVALAMPFFQKLDDHFTRINTTLAVLILVLTIFLGQALVPPHPRAWRKKLLALAAVALPCVAIVATSAYAMANPRAEMNIYSPIGRATAQLLGPLLPAPGESKDVTSTSLLATSAPHREGVLDTLKASRPLVITVVWDACRPDHMSLYGYQRTTPPLLPTTPNLDKNKDQFLRFTNCFSHGTGTTAAMRQMLTARYSSRWMLRTKGVAPFWLNELAANGYDAFFLNIIGSDYNGISLDAFHRDMPADQKERLECLACGSCPASARETLKEKEKNIRADYADLPKASLPRLVGLADKLKLIECNRQNEQRSVEDLLTFLDTRPDGAKGTFAYLHPDASHSPWQRYTEVEDFGGDEKNRYDQCIRYCDWVTGKLIDGLKQRGLWDQAIFIVIADHGTGLGEHGAYGGFHPWFEQIHVPLVIKLPGVKGRQIDTMVGLMDLGPTLVNIFSEAPLARYEGRSLWPVILRGETWPDRVMFGLNAFADCYYLLTADGLHYIKHRANQYEQLFNWREEPREKRNLMGLDRAATDRAQSLMTWFLKDYGRDRNYNDPDHYEAPPGQQ